MSPNPDAEEKGGLLWVAPMGCSCHKFIVGALHGRDKAAQFLAPVLAYGRMRMKSAGRKRTSETDRPYPGQEKTRSRGPGFLGYGGPWAIRTPDQLIKSQLLYRLS